MFAKHVRGDLTEVVGEIREEYTLELDTPSADIAAYIAAPHHFVRTTVERDENKDDLTRDPYETLERGGDCKDLCVLLASIYRTLSMPSRIVRVKNDSDQRHASLEVPIGAESVTGGPESVEAGIETFFERNGYTVDGLECRWRTTPRGRVLLADPVHSEYVGDCRSLSRGEYLRSADGEWVWTQHDEVFDTVVPSEGEVYNVYSRKSAEIQRHLEAAKAETAEFRDLLTHAEVDDGFASILSDVDSVAERIDDARTTVPFREHAEQHHHDPR